MSDTNQFYINNVKDARKCIGQVVYWDESDCRSVWLRKGVLDEVHGRNLLIDGDWQYRSRLEGLRNFENGGRWKRASENET